MELNSLNIIGGDLGFSDHDFSYWITPWKTSNEESADVAYYTNRYMTPFDSRTCFPDGLAASEKYRDELLMTIVSSYVHGGRLVSRLRVFHREFSQWFAEVIRTYRKCHLLSNIIKSQLGEIIRALDPSDDELHVFWDGYDSAAGRAVIGDVFSLCFERLALKISALIQRLEIIFMPVHPAGLEDRMDKLAWEILAVDWVNEAGGHHLYLELYG